MTLSFLLPYNIACFAVMVACLRAKRTFWCNISYAINNNNVCFTWEGFLPSKTYIFEFIARTSNDDNNVPLPPRKRQKKHEESDIESATLLAQKDPEDIVFNEDERSAPSRVIVFDDLMTDAFGKRKNEATMNLLTMKLSHHNNASVLIICHELYPKGKNSVHRDQLTSVHLHAIANQQKIRCYVYGFLSDDSEKRQFDHLFNEHILRINDSHKGNRRSSIFIHFTPGVCQDCFGVRRRIGRFLTFNECDFSVFHKMFDR